ncbi:MAG: primosomal replication protein N [Betaproteobacteria bacterium HGW-Betaproteobacteria-1]|nr:MAG: primosomal replication protein N [Betaproteobacteria bacterium HGW-Betaproteobacteria-1]
MNKLVLSGEVVQIEPLRYTPAGLPLLSFAVRHVSEQIEAGIRRKVECEMAVVAIGDIAKQAQGIQLTSQVKLAGFIAKRSLKSTQLVLHLNALEII